MTKSKSRGNLNEQRPVSDIQNSSDKGCRPLKITTVGDGMVGKTCLLITYTSKAFPKDYVPTVFDNYATTISVDNQTFGVTLWDTAGQEEYERLRPLSYPHTDCFLLCFSVVSRSSYENVYSKWAPEIRHHCPHVPIILVGTKTDIRDARDPEHLSYADGKKMKNKIKASAYMECSAILMENLDAVFVTAVRAVVKNSGVKQQRNCTIL